MKRKDVINHIIVAGYHNDMESFVRLYVENRIGHQAAEKAFEVGRKKRENGVECNCIYCKKNV